MSNMTAQQLYDAIKNGGKLRSRWKLRTFNNARMVHTLTLPDGVIQTVQKSSISSLIKHGKLRSIRWSGGEMDYEVVR